MASQRLDQEMVARALASSRAKAQSLIMEGRVLVDGKPADKPSRKATPSHEIVITGDTKDWVGRGAHKLIAVLDHFELDPSGMIAADIGASTGGFCEVLLERGVEKIYAVDVGHDQLHPSLVKNPKLVNLEGVNARNLTGTHIADPLDLVVSDVSFISLTKALPAALDLCRKGAWLLVLVKPQFEAGREHIGKGGIVRDPAIAQKVREDMEQWIETCAGWRCLGSIKSPIKGSDGNQEYLMGARYDG